MSIISTCFLEAISGTTPLYFSCISFCEETIFERISFPFLIVDAQVSSQEISIPRIKTSFLFPLSKTLLIFSILFNRKPNANISKGLKP